MNRVLRLAVAALAMGFLLTVLSGFLVEHRPVLDGETGPIIFPRGYPQFFTYRVAPDTPYTADYVEDVARTFVGKSRITMLKFAIDWAFWAIVVTLPLLAVIALAARLRRQPRPPSGGDAGPSAPRPSARLA